MQIEAKKATEESDNTEMKVAEAAVNCLSKLMLTELKGLPKPPAGVDKVANSCLILIKKEYIAKKQTWSRTKAMMQNVDAFKKSYLNSKEKVSLIKK